MSFLCQQPGDVEPEYFDDYTEAQLDFAEQDAENIYMFSMSEDDGGENFINLDGFVSAYKIECLGVFAPCEYRGQSTGYDWQDSSVGVGYNSDEALELALEQLAHTWQVDHIENDLDEETQCFEVPIPDDDDDCDHEYQDQIWVKVSVR